MSKATRAATAATLVMSALLAPLASADDPDWAGWLCGFATTTDDTGILSQDPTLHMGEMDGGPLVVSDLFDDESPGPSHTTTADGVLHCWIQVNQGTFAHFPNAKAHCDFAGHGVVAGACQVEYNASVTDNVYLCAMVEAHGTVWVHDEDGDPANGDQCGLGVSAGF